MRTVDVSMDSRCDNEITENNAIQQNTKQYFSVENNKKKYEVKDRYVF